MAAKHGISYHVLAKSEDIKKGIAARGYKPYNNHVSVSNAVKKYASDVKAKIIKSLEEYRKQGVRFSVTTDEWTDCANRGYGCFNLHMPKGKWVSIGSVRILDTLDANTAEIKLRQKLEEFGLSLQSDIVATTTDGASVMVKLGENIPSLHQLCHSHGCHLAVCDVLYKV